MTSGRGPRPSPCFHFSTADYEAKMSQLSQTAPGQVLAYSPADACKVGGFGKTTLYKLIAEGQIEAIALGGRTLIPAESLRQFLASLPPAPIKGRERP